MAGERNGFGALVVIHCSYELCRERERERERERAERERERERGERERETEREREREREREATVNRKGDERACWNLYTSACGHKPTQAEAIATQLNLKKSQIRQTGRMI